MQRQKRKNKQRKVEPKKMYNAKHNNNVFKEKNGRH